MKKIFLDLGMQPLANNLVIKKNLKKKEFKYPLKVQFDTKSLLVSLKNTVSSKKMFNKNYPYRSSSSKTVKKQYQILSNLIKKKMNPRNILEIGSNDGTFLKFFNKKKAFGIEPVKKHCDITNNLGYATYNNFWNMRLAKKIKKKHFEFDLIFSANTFSHIHNLKESLDCINVLLSNKGTFILEDPSLLKVILNTAYDQFYDEHIFVFSTLALTKLLKKHNLEITKIQNIDTHGGSNRYYINRIGLKKIDKSVIKNIKLEKKYKLDKISSYKKFSKRVKDSKKKLRKIFIILKNKNKKIVGYGASAKSTLIFNFCKLTKQEVPYFIDSTKDKQNKYLPGVKIKINKQVKKIPNNIDYFFLGAWNFYKEIKLKEKFFLKRGGKFITHIPFPRII